MTAIWTTPRTWVTGEVITAAQLNTHVRDNFDYCRQRLDAARPLVSAVSSAVHNTTSTTFVDIDPGTYVLSITTGGAPLLIGLAGQWRANTSGVDCCIDVELNGTRIGHAGYGLAYMQQPGAALTQQISFALVRTVAAGTHSLRLQWRVSSGTLTFNPIGGGQFYALELR